MATSLYAGAPSADRAILVQFVESLGFDMNHVTSMHIDVEGVTVQLSVPIGSGMVAELGDRFPGIQISGDYTRFSAMATLRWAEA